MKQTMTNKQKVIGLAIIITLLFFIYISTENVQRLPIDRYSVSMLNGYIDSSSNKGEQFLILEGYVNKESVKWDAENLLLQFNVTDGNSTLPVLYKGDVHKSFDIHEKIILEGKYMKDGYFLANKLIIIPDKTT
ncbi:MAG: cytochrome c maturation protein CcmE [Candidatus Methanoperedens sp.]